MAGDDPVEVEIRAPASPSFHEDGQVTGTRAGRPVSEVPQAITVLPSSVLESTGARRVEDVMLFVPSVQLGAGFGGVWDDYFVRGSRVWSGSIYRNGYLGGYSSLAALDAVNVERVEVLRGPAAALYGPSLPGGTINIVTKRPQALAAHTATLELGSFDTQRLTVDSTGPLTERSAYRVTAGFDTTASHRDFNDSNRFVLNPVFSFDPDERTRFLLETQLFRTRYRPDPGGTPMLDGDPFALPRSRSYAEPNAEKTRFDGLLLRSELTRRLTSTTTLRLGAQTQEALEQETALFPIGLRDDRRTIDRLVSHLELKSRDVALQGSLELETKLGWVRQDALIGVDARYEHVDYQLFAADPLAAPFPIDLYEPRYGSPRPELAPVSARDARWTYGDVGLYINDQLHLLRALRVVVSGRLDGYRQATRAEGTQTDQGEVAPSGRAGLIVTPLDALSFYGNLSYGFWPVLGVSATGALLEPERSRGLELGARGKLFNGAVTFDGALYRVDNRDITVPDPERPEFQVQRGASRSAGLELAASARIGEIVRALVSYAASYAEITDDANPALVGRPLPLTARYSGAAWSELAVPLHRALQLIVGIGGRLVGARHLNDGTRVPGYFRLDSSLGARSHFVELDLFVNNLLDEEYVQSGNDSLSILRGAPRAFFTRLTLLAR